MTARPRPASRRRQRGAALLTAMIIVTLVVTLASAMVWQQWRAVQVEAAERARAQSAWILSGALDWARLILREDLRSGRPTALTEPWAVPLAEARVSTFLAVDKDNTTDDGPEAFLSGRISDAQSHYNLRNLIGADGKIVPAEFAAVQRLFATLDIAAGVADRVAGGLRDALAPPGAAGAATNPPLLPQTLAQLAWLGVDDDSLRRMAPYVTLLPGLTKLNLNTAPRELLAAIVPGYDLSSAERLVQVRQRTPFKDLPAARAYLPPDAPVDALAVSSDFFEVRGRLRLGDRVLQESSLVQRVGVEVVVVQRQRVASTEAFP